jgi:2,3-bisphosphoglycerate-independent phosphoglycerate mutase
MVDSFAEQPAMATDKIVEAVVKGLENEGADFILVHFPAVDAVAHTGDLEATKQALVAVDAAVNTLIAAVDRRNGTLLVTSDHGNCELMERTDGTPVPMHTENLVPFAIAGRGKTALREGGSLCDVAPTILGVMGIEPPEEMTGSSLCLANDADPATA